MVTTLRMWLSCGAFDGDGFMVPMPMVMALWPVGGLLARLWVVGRLAPNVLMTL